MAEPRDLLPEGCTCYIRQDLDWGEILTQPPEGCPVHVQHDPSCQINKAVPPGFPWAVFTCNCDAGQAERWRLREGGGVP